MRHEARGPTPKGGVTQHPNASDDQHQHCKALADCRHKSSGAAGDECNGRGIDDDDALVSDSSVKSNGLRVERTAMTGSVRPTQAPTAVRNAAPLLSEYAAVGLVPRGRLARIRGQNVLLSAAQRAVFALMILGGYLALASRRRSGRSIRRDGGSGVDRTVLALCQAALQDWEGSA